MINDKVRAEFEEWIQSHGGDIRLNGEYVSNVTECAWQAWKASRAAQVVELPASVCRANQYHIEYTGELVTEHDEYYEIEDIKSALDAAGVAYK